LVLDEHINERELVAFIEAGTGKGINVVIKQSDLITQDTVSSPLYNANIDLLKNGFVVETRSTSVFGKADFLYEPKANDSLRVDIRYDTIFASSEVVVPKSVPIIQFDTTNRRANSLGLRLTFLDDARTRNYYLLDLKGKRWVYKFHPVSGKVIDSTMVSEPIKMNSVNRLFFSDNNIVNNRQNFELFNDRIFNGKNFVLDVDVSTFVLDAQVDKSKVLALDIVLKNITEDYYNFLTTLSLNRPVYGGPFSISSQVPSNISGGYGMFATYHSSSAHIDMHE
jgi:hypothetical protein